MGTVNVSASATPVQTAQRTTAGKEPMPLAHAGVLLFMAVYCVRPQDWIPGAAAMPFAKISGFLALASFFVNVLLERRGLLSLPREMIFLILLFGQLCLAVPFSIWRGGSFRIAVTQFSEVVLITIVIAMTTSSLVRLRRLMFVHAASVAVMTAVAVWTDRTMGGVYSRMRGVVGGVFDNPNELAISVALVFPFCFWFLLGTRGPVRKATWAVCMAMMSYAVLMTYSRAGLLALLTALIVCVLEFGLKGRRHSLVILAGLAGLCLLLFSGPVRYGERVGSMFNPDSDPTGSAQQRKELLRRGLDLTAEHPLFGVGPGNFQVVSGNWLATHNTYTELSSEAGIPALILFLLVFGRTFFNARRARQLASGDVSFLLLAGALRASLAAFVVGAFFEDTAYHFFPYFLVGYASALHQIARTINRRQPKPSQEMYEANNSAKTDSHEQKSKMAWALP